MIPSGLPKAWRMHGQSVRVPSAAAPLALEGAMGLDTPAEPISRCTAVKTPAEPRYDEGSGRGANSSAPVGM